MKKILALLILTALLTATIYGTTFVPAGSVQGNWTLIGSPYSVDYDIYIENGNELFIEAGVSVVFGQGVTFEVFGTLNVLGEYGNLVSFSTIGGRTWWNGMYILNSEMVNIEYTIFSWFMNSGVIKIQESKNITISDCIFEFNSFDPYNTDSLQGIIKVEGSNMVNILRNRFRGLTHLYSENAKYPARIFVMDTNNIFIDNNIFYDDNYFAMINIIISNGFQGTLGEITNNIFSNNITKYGAVFIENYWGNMVFNVTYNYFYSNRLRTNEEFDERRSAALNLLGKNFYVSHNRFVGNVSIAGGGILVEPNGKFEISHNEFITNCAFLGAGLYIRGIVQENNNYVQKIYRNIFTENSGRGDLFPNPGTIFITTMKINQNVSALNPSILEQGFHLKKNSIYQNSTIGILVHNSEFASTNDVIFENRDEGVYTRRTSGNLPMIAMFNSIVWDNGGEYQIFALDPPTTSNPTFPEPIIRNTVLTNGFGGTNYIIGDFQIHSMDPQFADIFGHIFRVTNPFYDRNPYIGIYPYLAGFTPSHTTTLVPTWNWVSFPKFERQNIYDDTEAPWGVVASPIGPHTIFIQRRVFPFPTQTAIRQTINPITWDVTFPFQSSRGYKIYTTLQDPQTFSFDITGTTLYPNTIIPLHRTLQPNGETYENWVGYFLPRTIYLLDALHPSTLRQIYKIQTEQGGIYYTGDDILMGNFDLTISFGQMVAIWLKPSINPNPPPIDFRWEKGIPTRVMARQNSVIFTYNQLADYVSVFVEIDDDTEEIPCEIAIFVNGICKGATVYKAGINEILVYLEPDDFGEEMEIVFGFTPPDGVRDLPQLRRINDFGIVNYKNNRKLEHRALVAQPQVSFHHIKYSRNNEDNDSRGLTTPFVELSQNFPNPFNPSTTINFTLSHTNNNVKLSIYNIRGQKVKDLHTGSLPAGNHTLMWHGTDNENRNVGSGIYFYRLVTDSDTITRRMVLLK